MSEGAKIRINYFCLGAVLIFVGSILLCALGITVVLPFEATRVWPEVTCTVLNASYNPNVCSCDEQLNIYDKCISKYPCLQVYVRYTQKFEGQPMNSSGLPTRVTVTGYESNSSVTITAATSYSQDEEFSTFRDLTTNRTSQTFNQSGYEHRSKVGKIDDLFGYDPGVVSDLNSLSESRTSFQRKTSDPYSSTEYSPSTEIPVETIGKLYRSWDDSFYHQCSLTECGDETWNIKESKRFKSEWGMVGRTFTCYYDPRHPTSLIIERIESTSAIHAIAWPAACLLLGVTLWIGLCIGCCSTRSEYSTKEEHGHL